MIFRRVFRHLAPVATGLLLALSAQADLIDQPGPPNPAADMIDTLLKDPTSVMPADQSTVFGPVVRAIEDGNLEEAARQLSVLKNTHPDAAGTWELDGAVNLARRRFDDAERSLRRAAELAPETGSIRTKLGAALLARDKEFEAVQNLRQALELDATESDAALMLARLERQRGKMAEAVALYKQAIRDGVGFSTAHRELAELYLQAGNYESALELVASLAGPDSSGAGQLVATKAYIGLARFDEARAALYKARKLGLAEEQVMLHQAVLARFAGDMDESRSILDTLVARYPGRPLLMQELAITLAAAGDSGQSREVALRAAGMLPDAHPTRTALANLLLAQGFADDALEIAKDSMSSTDPNALVMIIRAGILADELTIADDASRRLLHSYPEFSEAYSYRSEVLLAMGKRAQAVEVAEQGTRRLRQNPAAWSSRIGLLLRLANYDGAAKLARDAVRVFPDDSVFRLQLANALQSAGDTKEAEDLYRELTGDDSTAVIALNNLANLLSADPKRRAEALRFARRAHEIAPDSVAVNDTLGWLLHLNGKSDEAHKLLVGALEAAADDIGVICHLGIVKADVEGVEAARGSLERCAADSDETDLASEAARLLGRS